MSSRGESQGGPTILDINTGFIRDSRDWRIFSLVNLFKIFRTRILVCTEGCYEIERLSCQLWVLVSYILLHPHSLLALMEAPIGIPLRFTTSTGILMPIGTTHRITITQDYYTSTKEEDFTGGDLVFYDADSGQPRLRARMTSIRQWKASNFSTKSSNEWSLSRQGGHLFQRT